MNVTHHDRCEDFATDVVRRLQEAGYEAFWAGGCVRDRIQGKPPKDYDVATSAMPKQVRELFGHRRTLAIGESFGVIVVLGPRAAGQVEVATFRVDMGYSDGRRPDAVAFRSAEEDAQRRDFTINGMFYDPIAGRSIDYVGGEDDLRRGIVRAIGDPQQRIFEDKLRMLRAVRFAATLNFRIDPATLAAIQEHAQDIQVVSAERKGVELRRMFTDPHRARAFELLCESRLMAPLLPESSEFTEASLDEISKVLAALPECEFALPLSVLLRKDTEGEVGNGKHPLADRVCEAWKLSNRDRKLTRFLLTNESLVRSARNQPWPRLQKVLIHDDAVRLLQYATAISQVVDGDLADVAFCQAKLQLPVEELNPPPLLTGNDLQQMNVPPGKVYREILESLRNEQLCNRIATRVDAMKWVERFMERES